MRQYWNAPIPPFQTADANLNTFTTAADVALVPQVTLPANILEVGSTLRISAQGNWSSTGSPTFTYGFYYGGVTTGIALAIGSAITVGAGAASWPWSMEWFGRVRAVGSGSAGSIVGQGFQDNGGASLTAITRIPVPLTLALRTVAIDTTVAKTITVGCACSASSASNIFLVNSLVVELIG